MVVVMHSTANQWPFYFQGSALPLSMGGSWSGSLCKVHVALQELTAVVPMLHRLAIQLSGKAVTLQLNTSTANAYLCNQGGTVSHFLSRVACHILNPADKYSITLIPVYIPIHLNVKANYLSCNKLVLEWHLLPKIAQAVFQLWDHPEVDLVASSCTHQCQFYYTLENCCLQELWDCMHSIIYRSFR